MAMSMFNTVRITQLKEKTVLILDVVHLHEKQQHLEEKLDQRNKLLADLLESNIEKKFTSVVHHHKNVVKSAQHYRLAPGALPHDVLGGIIDHVVQVAKKKNLVPFVKFALDLFQIEVSHLYTLATNEFTLILHIPIVANSNLLNLYEFLPLPIHFHFASNMSITPDVGPSNLLAIGHSQSATRNLFKQFPCLHPPWRHFLLQRKESHGNKLVKILFRCNLYGQLPINPEPLPDSRSLKPARKFSNYLRTLGLCTQWGLSVPTRSAQQPMTSQRCRSSPETPSGSNQGAMSAPWITSSQLMNPKQLRSRSRPWTGPA